MLAGLLVLSLIRIRKVYDWSKTPPQTYQYRYVREFETEELERLDIRWANGNIRVRVIPEGNRVRVTECTSQRLAEADMMAVSLSGGELGVKWRDELMTIGLLEQREKRLFIEIPAPLAGQLAVLHCQNGQGNIDVAANLTLVEAKAKTGKGDVELVTVHAQSMKVSSGTGAVHLLSAKIGTLQGHASSGRFHVENCDVQEADVKTVTDDIVFTGVVREVLTATSVSGGVQYLGKVCPMEAALSSGSGAVTLQVPAQSGFQLDYESVYGELQSDFQMSGTLGKNSGHGAYEDGSAKLRLATTSGDIYLRRGAA